MEEIKEELIRLNNIRRNLLKELNKIDSSVLKLEKEKRKPKNRKQYTLPRNQKYLTYLKRANAKRFEFELTEQHFNELDSCTCQYCGDSASGFDRIDSKQGYTLNNVVPCCGTCNTMKWTMSTNQFQKHIEKIYRYINSANEADIF